jgi:hypothetical protein
VTSIEEEYANMAKSNKGAKPTIQIRASNRRAVQDVDLLFHWLEQFVNLDDDPQSWKEFCEEHPQFFPVMFTVDWMRAEDEHPRLEFAGYKPEFYELFRTFRDMLRGVWRSGSETQLAILLGVDTIGWQIITRRGGAPELEKILGGPYAIIEQAMAKIASYFQVGPSNRFYNSNLAPDWRTGTFRYDPDTEFRCAVYALFRQSWRAKVCPRCGKYFIGDKPPQTYCSTKCYGNAKRDRDVQFWRSKGSARRQQRMSRKKESPISAGKKSGRE